MHLEVQADGGVEEFDQQLRMRAEFRGVGRAEEVIRVGGEERGEVVGDAADEGGGEAFAEVVAAGVDGGGGGAKPVLRKMGVCRRGAAGEGVEGASALVGAPDAVGREQHELSTVGGHRLAAAARKAESGVGWMVNRGRRSAGAVGRGPV
jgi:hypothetical protein